MNPHLAALLRDIDRAAPRDLAAVVERVAMAAERAASAVERVAGVVEQMASLPDRVASAVERVASALERIASTVPVELHGVCRAGSTAADCAERSGWCRGRVAPLAARCPRFGVEVKGGGR